MGSRGNLAKAGLPRLSGWVRALRSLRSDGCGVSLGRSWRGRDGFCSEGFSSTTEVRFGCAGSEGPSCSSGLVILRLSMDLMDLWIGNVSFWWVKEVMVLASVTFLSLFETGDCG